MRVGRPSLALVWTWWMLALGGCGGSTAPEAPAVSEAASSRAPGSGVDSSHLKLELHPEVVLHTSAGAITLRLDAAKAPRTVQNFLQYVESGHYDGTIFHQVNAGYVALGGGYTPELRERTGRYPISNEANNGLRNRRGTIAMARRLDVVDSSTCQFFINLADNPKLDHQGSAPEAFGFCVFGEVTEGLDVLEHISQTPVKSVDGFENLPVETVQINSAVRTR